MPHSASNQPTPNDVLTFLSAAGKGDITTVRSMLDQYGAAIINENETGYDPNDPFHTGQQHHTLPLHGAALLQAAYYGHADVVTLLIDEGADIDIQSKYSWTALMLAAMQRNVDIVELLLTEGANADIVQTEKNQKVVDFAPTDIAELIRNRPQIMKRQKQEELRRQAEAEAAEVAEKRLRHLRESAPPKPKLKKSQKPRL